MKKNLFIFLALVMLAGLPTQALDMKAWSRSVMVKIAKNQHYPRSAINREIEGRAVVQLTVDTKGNITKSEILQPTGHRVLDREIPKLLERVNPLPPLPDGRSALTFKVPLTWAL